MQIDTAFIVKEYIEEHLFEPACNWPACYFEQRSYSRWAATEVLTRVHEQDLYSSIDIIKSFINKMDDLSCVNQQTNSIFSIARDTAKEILDIFLAMV